MYKSVGTSTYSKFNTNNRHSLTHKFSAPRGRGHANYDNKEFNSMPYPHNSRMDGKQQPQTSHLDDTQSSQTVHPDYRQPQMFSRQHHGEPQQFSRPGYRHSSVTPSHPTKLQLLTTDKHAYTTNCKQQ